MRCLNCNRRGFSLIELILALGIFVLLIGGVTAPLVGSYLNTVETSQNARAYDFWVDGYEALRVSRAADWANVVSSSSTRDIFTRQITVTDVQRDENGVIVESGGTVDPDSKQVLIEVSWQNTANRTRTLSATTLLTNYRNAGDWPLIPPEE